MPAPTPLLPPTTSPPPLPAPHTFDLLSGLHPLLSRLLLPVGATSSSTSPIGGVPASISPTAAPPSSSSHNTNRAIADDPTVPLSPKDFPAAVQQVYARIGKARQVVRAMDGVEMSVGEQEAVVRELEGEVRRGRDVLTGLARRAGGMVAEGRRLDDDGADLGMDMGPG